MRKILTAAVAALTLAGGMAASVTSAEARPYDRRYHRDNDHGDAVVAGIAGLAIGAALASSNRDRGYYRDRYYDRRYYNRGYYAPRYYDRGYYGRGYYAPPRYAYRNCRTVRVWDPYYGRTVRERRCW